MSQEADNYTEFVNHPRYGREPRITGLNPKPYSDGVHLFWHTTTHNELKAAYEKEGGHYPGYDWDAYGPYSRRTRRIANTAIVADLERQTPATMPVTHYFDLARTCVDCKRPFIFFADEQKYWYEDLGFGLDSDCIRCVECRKKQQGIALHREAYESLFHVPNRSDQQNIEMADACLSLMEAGIFPRRKAESVRMLFNAVPLDSPARQKPGFADLARRLLAVEHD